MGARKLHIECHAKLRVIHAKLASEKVFTPVETVVVLVIRRTFFMVFLAAGKCGNY
jgi:hypothetical protein